MAQHPIKKTAGLPGALGAGGGEGLAYSDYVDENGNYWVRVANGNTGSAITGTTGVTLVGGVDPLNNLRGVSVNAMGRVELDSDDALQLILATLQQIVFVLSQGLGIDPPTLGDAADLNTAA